MPVKVRVRHRRLCIALLEESIGKPAPCWVSIDKLARLLSVSYEAAYALAYDCEKADLASFDRSHTATAGGLKIEPPRNVCLTARGWRLIRKPRARKDDRQPNSGSWRRAAD